MPPPDVYTVTIEDPDGNQVTRQLSGELLQAVRAGPLEPHAKAAYLASIEIQAASERGELDDCPERAAPGG